MKRSGAIILTIVLLAGAVLGEFAARLTEDISWLSWLSFGSEFGISADKPFMLDLGVLRLAFGIDVSLNIAIILGLALAFVFYKKVAK